MFLPGHPLPQEARWVPVSGLSPSPCAEGVEATPGLACLLWLSPRAVAPATSPDGDSGRHTGVGRGGTRVSVVAAGVTLAGKGLGG